MHATEREQLILRLLDERGFIGFKELDKRIDASPATVRRDLERLAEGGMVIRVRGGARRAGAAPSEDHQLNGVPFHENIERHPSEKAAIGRAGAALCLPGETVIIDGGSTTLQMCSHLTNLGLHVVTTSLHIVSALMPQSNTRISIPGGTVFREQSIVLSAFDDDGSNRFRASKMFLGAAAVGAEGLMQTDILLIHAERRLLGRADKIIVLVDSSKFEAPAGHLLCRLDEVSTIVTDAGIAPAAAQMIKKSGVELIVAR